MAQSGFLACWEVRFEQSLRLQQERAWKLVSWDALALPRILLQNMAVGFVDQCNDIFDTGRFVDTPSVEHNLLIINKVEGRGYRWPRDHGTRCFECNDPSLEIWGHWDRIVFVTQDIANPVVRPNIRQDYRNAVGSIPWMTMFTTSPATANSLLSSTERSAISAAIKRGYISQSLRCHLAQKLHCRWFEGTRNPFARKRWQH